MYERVIRNKRYVKEEISRNHESENLRIRGLILRKRVKSQEEAETGQWWVLN